MQQHELETTIKESQNDFVLQHTATKHNSASP